MPDGEIAGDFCSLDSDADASDIHLSSSSFASSSSSSSFSSSYSTAGVEVGVSTDDPSARMEKDPRKIARRFDFQIFFSFFRTPFTACIFFCLLACLHDSADIFVFGVVVFRFPSICKFVAE